MGSDECVDYRRGNKFNRWFCYGQMDDCDGWFIVVNWIGMCSYRYKIIEVEKKVHGGYRLILTIHKIIFK